LDLGSLHSHLPNQNQLQRFFIIPLLGKVKGEYFEARTGGWSRYFWWKGRVLNLSSIDQSMHEILEELFTTQSELFLVGITTKDDIVENYHAFRSFRRSLDTSALKQCVGREDINLLNCWHQVEKADGSRPVLDMRYHYAQYDLLIEQFLHSTSSIWVGVWVDASFGLRDIVCLFKVALSKVNEGSIIVGEAL
jgi:hypothetical protein